MSEEQKRMYYSISDVSDMIGLKAHILRFWESEFPMLKPRKNRAGNRAYTERDIKIIKLIKYLLYDEKYTIDGAKARLKTDHQLLETQLALPLSAERRVTGMEEIRNDLINILNMVESI